MNTKLLDQVGVRVSTPPQSNVKFDAKGTPVSQPVAKPGEF